MNENEYKFLHDLTNKLVSLDGKLRRIKKCESTMEILCEVDKIKSYNDEALLLLQEYKRYIETLEK